MGQINGRLASIIIENGLRTGDQYNVEYNLPPRSAFHVRDLQKDGPGSQHGPVLNGPQPCKGSETEIGRFSQFGRQVSRGSHYDGAVLEFHYGI